MPEFEIESKLKINLDTLATDLFSMEAVNHELSPIVRMSAPPEWRSVPINQWQCGEFLFTSRISLFGVLPIDLHRFQLSEVGSTSIKETSSSLINKHWNHQRSIKRLGNGSVVCDRVQYTSRLRPLGYLLLPVFKWLFRHRHRYLKSKYGESN